MSERPATRADLRAAAWLTLRAFADDPGAVQHSLAALAAIDADERDDACGARYVADRLKRAVVVTDSGGRLVGLRWREPVPTP